MFEEGTDCEAKLVP